jgi:uncharacterized protein (DUF4213/DUF364 family)
MAAGSRRCCTLSIAADLLLVTRRVATCIDVPPVTQIVVPPGGRDAGIEGEFGLVVLEDGSAGFFFALLGDTLARLQARAHGPGRPESAALALAEGMASDDSVERAVALGVICAVTQHLFRRAGFRPGAAANALGGGAFSAADHVGMVGLFPSLARRLRDQGVRLTVLELRPDKIERGPRFQVTMDPRQLRHCNTILCTASTLINGTLDAVLALCARAQRIALIGPSASCFPDPLFARGIHVVGGAAVTDTAALLARLGRGESWGETVERYTIDAGVYPGTSTLLGRLVP